MENGFGIKKYDCTFKAVYNFNTINCILLYKPYNHIYITRFIKGNIYGINIYKRYGRE